MPASPLMPPQVLLLWRLSLAIHRPALVTSQRQRSESTNYR
jgi:hypothetical protein